MGITGIRVLRRVLREHVDSSRRARPSRSASAIPTMLVGAGQGGVLMTKELAARPDLGFKPVGFLDDDATKVGPS